MLNQALRNLPKRKTNGEKADKLMLCLILLKKKRLRSSRHLQAMAGVEIVLRMQHPLQIAARNIIRGIPIMIKTRENMKTLMFMITLGIQILKQVNHEIKGGLVEHPNRVKCQTIQMIRGAYLFNKAEKC